VTESNKYANQKKCSGNIPAGEMKCFPGILLPRRYVPLPCCIYLEQVNDVCIELVASVINRDGQNRILGSSTGNREKDEPLGI
jgi:hypothetical protein